eukprot:403353963
MNEDFILELREPYQTISNPASNRESLRKKPVKKVNTAYDINHGRSQSTVHHNSRMQGFNSTAGVKNFKRERSVESHPRLESYNVSLTKMNQNKQQKRDMKDFENRVDNLQKIPQAFPQNPFSQLSKRQTQVQLPPTQLKDDVDTFKKKMLDKQYVPQYRRMRQISLDFEYLKQNVMAQINGIFHKLRVLQRQQSATQPFLQGKSSKLFQVTHQLTISNPLVQLLCVVLEKKATTVLQYSESQQNLSNKFQFALSQMKSLKTTLKRRIAARKSKAQSKIENYSKLVNQGFEFDPILNLKISLRKPIFFFRSILVPSKTSFSYLDLLLFVDFKQKQTNQRQHLEIRLIYDILDNVAGSNKWLVDYNKYKHPLRAETFQDLYSKLKLDYSVSISDIVVYDVLPDIYLVGLGKRIKAIVREVRADAKSFKTSQMKVRLSYKN